jgi:hypothetical protein
MLKKTLTVLAFIAGTSPAIASDYAFTLHNKAAGYTINGFYTYQNGEWSDNWFDSGERVKPGETMAMDWFSNEGNCVVPFRVSWENYGADDFKMDWCKHPKNIYMKDKGFEWD